MKKGRKEASSHALHSLEKSSRQSVVVLRSGRGEGGARRRRELMMSE